MLFSCPTETLARATADLSRIVNKSGTVPILKHVCIVASRDTVELTATNLETTLRATIVAEVREPGATTVDADLLAKYVGASNAEVLDVSLASNGQLLVTGGRAKFSANTLPADEFPSLPKKRSQLSFAVDAKQLGAALAGTTFAASREEARGPVLGSVRLKIDADGTATIAATDGYVLALRPMKIADAASIAGEYMIPAYACSEISKIIGRAEKGAAVSVSFIGDGANDAQSALFATADREISVRLVAGSYPKLEAVIPKAFDRSAVVDTKAFIGALKRSALVGNSKLAPHVVLTVEDSSITLTSTSDTIGSAFEELDADVTGEGVTISFNADYLLALANHIVAEKMRFDFVGPLSPVSVRPEDSTITSDDLYIIMPMRR